MSFIKIANTESAQAFSEAVTGWDEKGTTPRPESDRMKRTPVSWSDSDSVAYSDDANVDTRGPSVKAAALMVAANNAQGPHADMVKQAFVGALARGAVMAGKGLLAAGGMGAKGVGAMGKGVLGAIGKGVEGYKGVGAAANKAGLFNKVPTAKSLVGNVGAEVGFAANDMSHLGKNW